MASGSAPSGTPTGDSPRKRLSRHLARVMAQQPHPPRQVSTVDLLPYTLVLPQESRRARTGLLVLAGVGVAVLAVEWGPVRVLLGLVGLPIALALATGPLRLAFRLGWAARHGTMASAVVSDRVSDEVLCEVNGPRGPFRTAVDLEEPPDPKPAERLLVILHPEEDEVLWCLGPAGG